MNHERSKIELKITIFNREYERAPVKILTNPWLTNTSLLHAPLVTRARPAPNWPQLLILSPDWWASTWSSVLIGPAGVTSSVARPRGLESWSLIGWECLGSGCDWCALVISHWLQPWPPVLININNKDKTISIKTIIHRLYCRMI